MVSSGSSSGLKLLVNAESYDYLAKSDAETAAVKVMVHDENDVPRIEDLGWKVESNYAMDIRVKVTKVRGGRENGRGF